MKYLKIINSNPTSKAYNEIQGLARSDGYSYERFDRNSGKWIKDPGLLRGISGLGGDDSDYRPISDIEANQIIDCWKK